MVTDISYAAVYGSLYGGVAYGTKHGANSGAEKFPVAYHVQTLPHVDCESNGRSLHVNRRMKKSTLKIVRTAKHFTMSLSTSINPEKQPTFWLITIYIAASRFSQKFERRSITYEVLTCI